MPMKLSCATRRRSILARWSWNDADQAKQCEPALSPFGRLIITSKADNSARRCYPNVIYSEAGALLGDVALETTIPSLFASTQKGDPAAAQQLFQALYGELHRVAKRELVRNGALGSL